MRRSQHQLAKVFNGLQELADSDTKPMSQKAYDQLKFDMFHLDRPSHVDTLKSFYEQPDDSVIFRFFTYQLLKHTYISQRRFKELSALPYQPPPDGVFYIINHFSYPSFYDGFHPGRDVAGLVALCRHDDPVLRVQAITLLFNMGMLSSRTALFQQLNAVTWLEEMRYILDLIEGVSIPGGAAAIMAFVHRMQLLAQEPIDKRFKFYEDSKDVTFECGANIWRIVRGIRIDLPDCTYRALIVLSAQPRYTPAAEMASTYLDDPERCGPAMVCLLKHSPLRDLKKNLQLLDNLLDSRKLEILHPNHGYDPVLECFSLLLKYRRPEIKALYKRYTREKKTWLTVIQRENLRALKDEFR